MADRKQAWWLIFALAVATVWTIAACSGEDSGSAIDPGPGTSVGATDPGTSSGGAESSSGIASSSGGGSSSGKTSSSGGSSGASSSGGGSSGGGSSGGGSSGASSSGGSSGTSSSGGSSGTVTNPNATEKNFKVAFIGDTDTGSDFKSVLALVKAEGADLVVVQGDLTYSFHSASSWFSAIDSVLQTSTTKIPYFAARGNHDWSWTSAGGLGAGLDSRLTTWGVTPDNAKPSNANYALTYKGLKIVFADESETTPSRADYVKAQLSGDTHIWKICSFHKNQRATNVGPKSDEMGWPIYENCRSAGAIVAQGHSHTYSRSKTITADQTQTVDPTCSDPFALCVGPGKHFFFDSSLGGTDMRTLENTNHTYWASTYASDFGALFIEFYVDNDPKKATGYFKTVGGTIIDPPASSGKTFFTITAQ
jgi:predicted phosphodiesterase